MNKKDPLLGKAKQVIRQHPKGYAGTLQRYLDIGYSRAAGILDILAEENFISLTHGDYKLRKSNLFLSILKELALGILGFILLVGLMFAAIIAFGGPV